jgi:hypothetical protein
MSLAAGGSVNGTTEKAVAQSITFNTSALAPGTYTGNITVTAAGVAGSPKVVAVELVVGDAPITNDNFAGAFPVVGNSLTTSALTAGFTVEAGEPATVAGFNTGASAWWNWTNTSGTNKNVTLTVSTASFDTQLSVYTGAAVNALTLIAEADEVPPTLETVNFVAAPGQTYRIRLAGYNGESGTATFNGTLPAQLSLMAVE